MPSPVLFSIIESPTHPDFSSLYRRLGYNEIKLGSTRKSINQLKKQKPDVVVAEFFYGYGNNYAGVNISNLDVFLYSIERFAPDARIIVIVDKSERQHVDKLNNIVPLHTVLVQRVSESAMEAALAQPL